jgi:biotin carboxyl carrier protein
LKLHIEVDGEEYTLGIRCENGGCEYTLQGGQSAAGLGSVVQVSPGVFSILLEGRSFTVHIASRGEELEVWTAPEQHLISVSDARDRSGRHTRAVGSGPMEVRAQMPGKVIKLLVEKGTAVQAGQGLIVVEAMKMQNEMKAPKDGMISRINVAEGATVAAGQPLIVVD